MFNINFLLSMPGGAEWLLVIIMLTGMIIGPVLAIVYYLQVRRLRQENKELMARLFDKDK